MYELFLSLYLDAPMQSWGYSSRFDHRTTGSWPTKSGVIGMLCAALGIPRSDYQSIESLSSLKMTVLVLREASIRWIDFHTVGGGNFDDKRCMSRKANNTRPTPVVTHREYLAEARFGVILSGDNNWIDKCAQAVKNPVWGIWFGRKSCIPSSPVFQGLHPSEKSAMAKLMSFSINKHIRIIRDADVADYGSLHIRDVPVNFAKKTYRTRYYDELFEENYANFRETAD